MLEQIIGERIWNGILTCGEPVPQDQTDYRSLAEMAQDLVLVDDVITARKLYDGEAVLRIHRAAPHRFVVEVYEAIDLS
jgi:hypothetical protein